MILNLLNAFFSMVWEIYWALAFGFILSSLIRVMISSERISAGLGNTSPKSISLATLFGAVSSSCSYAAASMSRTLLMKGSSLSNALAFMVASTNLVFEIFIVLIALLGWAFFWGELIGGIFFIILLALLISKFFPKHVLEELKRKVGDGSDMGKSCHNTEEHDHQHHDHEHDHSAMVMDEDKSIKSKLLEASGHFYMDVAMVGKDILIGIAVSAVLMVFVPQSFWHALFLDNSSDLPFWVQSLWNAFIGVVVAIISFVCSVGNVVLAGVLWHGGISFGGVIAFILADLVTLPMLSVYRRYYGLRPALWIALFLIITILATGLFLDFLFSVLGMIPESPQGQFLSHSVFQWNYKAVLNLIFIPVSIIFFYIGKKQMGSHDMHH